jgi:hypothetical protein
MEIKKFGDWLGSLHEHDPALIESLSKRFNELFMESTEDAVDAAKKAVGSPVDDVDIEAMFADPSVNGSEVIPEPTNQDIDGISDEEVDLSEVDDLLAAFDQ